MARRGRRHAQPKRPQASTGTGRNGVIAVGAVILALIVAIGFAVVGGLNEGAGSDGTDSAPDFALSVYQGDESLAVGDIAFADVIAVGKPVVLNFWAGLCPPCRAEMPGFQSVYERNRGEFILLGVDVGVFTGLGSRADGTRLLEQLGTSYPIASVPNARSLQQYGVLSMPTTVFITAQGRFHRTVNGSVNEAAMEDLVRDLILTSGLNG
ncbi:MAG: TlpA disulfide reductase family protein [Chloroflexi bacterium]|nr:TlpA disulfide reductase family protein [Chloroflexota bacterium]